eukprot:TRINITY_DN3261_c0_g1_i1.p1 TRINITY_DN3261_c0_g1~~TRINITY_DN3261_c0_g1_i1.p1  ORF type:complete len:1368 (+),score=324.12 TRINITY_DN3261_c0_g1_i1:26-4105(+)
MPPPVFEKYTDFLQALVGTNFKEVVAACQFFHQTVQSDFRTGGNSRLLMMYLSDSPDAIEFFRIIEQLDEPIGQVSDFSLQCLSTIIRYSLGAPCNRICTNVMDRSSLWRNILSKNRAFHSHKALFKLFSSLCKQNFAKYTVDLLGEFSYILSTVIPSKKINKSISRSAYLNYLSDLFNDPNIYIPSSFVRPALKGLQYDTPFEITKFLENFSKYLQKLNVVASRKYFDSDFLALFDTLLCHSDDIGYHMYEFLNMFLIEKEVFFVPSILPSNHPLVSFFNPKPQHSHHRNFLIGLVKKFPQVLPNILGQWSKTHSGHIRPSVFSLLSCGFLAQLFASATHKSLSNEVFSMLQGLIGSNILLQGLRGNALCSLCASTILINLFPVLDDECAPLFKQMFREIPGLLKKYCEHDSEAYNRAAIGIFRSLISFGRCFPAYISYLPEVMTILKYWSWDRVLSLRTTFLEYCSLVPHTIDMKSEESKMLLTVLVRYLGDFSTRSYAFAALTSIANYYIPQMEHVYPLIFSMIKTDVSAVLVNLIFEKQVLSFVELKNSIFEDDCPPLEMLGMYGGIPNVHPILVPKLFISLLFAALQGDTSVLPAFSHPDYSVEDLINYGDRFEDKYPIIEAIFENFTNLTPNILEIVVPVICFDHRFGTFVDFVFDYCVINGDLSMLLPVCKLVCDDESYTILKRVKKNEFNNQKWFFKQLGTVRPYLVVKVLHDDLELLRVVVSDSIISRFGLFDSVLVEEHHDTPLLNPLLLGTESPRSNIKAEEAFSMFKSLSQHNKFSTMLLSSEISEESSIMHQNLAVLFDIMLDDEDFIMNTFNIPPMLVQLFLHALHISDGIFNLQIWKVILACYVHDPTIIDEAGFAWSLEGGNSRQDNLKRVIDKFVAYSASTLAQVGETIVYLADSKREIVSYSKNNDTEHINHEFWTVFIAHTIGSEIIPVELFFEQRMLVPIVLSLASKHSVVRVKALYVCALILQNLQKHPHLVSYSSELIAILLNLQPHLASSKRLSLSIAVFLVNSLPIIESPGKKLYDIVTKSIVKLNTFEFPGYPTFLESGSVNSLLEMTFFFKILLNSVLTDGMWAKCKKIGLVSTLLEIPLWPNVSPQLYGDWLNIIINVLQHTLNGATDLLLSYNIGSVICLSRELHPRFRLVEFDEQLLKIVELLVNKIVVAGSSMQLVCFFIVNLWKTTDKLFHQSLQNVLHVLMLKSNIDLSFMFSLIDSKLHSIFIRLFDCNSLDTDHLLKEKFTEFSVLTNVSENYLKKGSDIELMQILHSNKHPTVLIKTINRMIQLLKLHSKDEDKKKDIVFENELSPTQYSEIIDIISKRYIKVFSKSQTRKNLKKIKKESEKNT